MKHLTTLLLVLTALAGAPALAADEQNLYFEAMQLMSENRYDEAKAVFERLLEIEPQHAGAWLDLAITHCALGDAVQAERLFHDIELRFTPSSGILEIINAHRAKGCRPWLPKTLYSVALTRAADTNINQGASNPIFVSGGAEYHLADDFLPKRDRYTQAAFDFSRELSPQGANAFAQLRLRRHDNATEQDTNALLLGADRIDYLGHWPLRSQGSVSLVTLGGQLYQRQFQWQSWVAPPMPMPEHTSLVLSAALSHIEYANRRNFDANTGELGAVLTYRGPRHMAQAGVGLLDDRGEAARLGGNRHGWYGSVQLQPQLSEKISTELGWTRQDWHGASIYSPDLVEAVREQSTRQWRLAVGLPLAARQSLLLEWRHVQNKENISLFQYSSQSLQLTWRWSGF